MELSGPTNFNRIIKESSRLAKTYRADHTLGYSVMIIITDGSVSDMKETISELKEASNYPLSFIVVGVGQDSFEDMIYLDNDSNTLLDSDD